MADRRQKYVFVGDKFTVLHRMRKHSLDVVSILCAQRFSHGQPLSEPHPPVETVVDKTWLLEKLDSLTFDVLVSNGCPFILPVSQLQKPGQLFINIHASMLPKYPGPHPVNGAMIAGDDGGATCHYMVDAIDSGPIISQVKVPRSPEMDVGLMYVLTDLAEGEAFELALNRNFAPDPTLAIPTDMSTYFKVTAERQQIDFSLDAESIKRHVRAFGIYSQGATFVHQGHPFLVFDAELTKNPFLLSRSDNYKENEVVFIYDSTVVIKKDSAFLLLKNVNTKTGTIKVGEILGHEDQS